MFEMKTGRSVEGNKISNIVNSKPNDAWTVLYMGEFWARSSEMSQVQHADTNVLS